MDGWMASFAKLGVSKTSDSCLKSKTGYPVEASERQGENDF